MVSESSEVTALPRVHRVPLHLPPAPGAHFCWEMRVAVEVAEVVPLPVVVEVCVRLAVILAVALPDEVKVVVRPVVKLPVTELLEVMTPVSVAVVEPDDREFEL